MSRSGDPFSDRINEMAKVVVSSTPTDLEWPNTTVIAGDPVQELRRLKEQPGLDIVRYGFGRLAHTLVEHGLLDELRLCVHPFFVGRGGPEGLLYRDGLQAMFTLADTTVLKGGTVILAYELR